MCQPINTGLLSFGMSGRIFHAPFIQAHPGFHLNAVTERHHKKANQFYSDIKSFQTTEELINLKELELIVINTPNHTHFKYAKQALRAGKHLLVEKPFTTSLSEAQELLQLGKEVQCKVMVYQNRRWDSDFQSVKNVVQSGKLGKLIEVHFRFDRYNNNAGLQTLKTPAAGSGIVYGLMPHLLDQAICLFGKPIKYFKSTGCNRSGAMVDDYAFLHLGYPNNLNVFLHASLFVAKPLPAFVLHGIKGSYIQNRTDVQEKQLDQGLSPLDKNYGLEMPGAEGELTVVDDASSKTTEYLSAIKGDYIQFYEAVYQHIRNYKPFPVKDEQLLWQMEMIEEKNNQVPVADNKKI